MVNTSGASSVRFARRSTRGLLLGFSTPRVIVFAAAAAVAVAALFIAGATAFVVTGLVWGPLVASGVIRVAGRPVIEWSATALHYGARRAGGQHQFRARPTRPRPAGTLALPGDAASLRLHVDELSGAAMIHDPHRQTLTAVIPVSHPAFALLDDADRAGRVGRWGRVLAGLAASGTCAAIQVLEATVPDPARGQREWWAKNGRHDLGWADSQYQALLDQVSLDSSTHRTTISLSLDMRAAARAVRAGGRGVRGGAAVLRSDMAALTDGLRSAGLRTGRWMGETDLAAVVRHAFDPDSGLDPRSDPAANLGRAGPMAVSESWDRLRHDTGWSQVLWISEWPRIAVPADFLHPIIFAPGVRRSLCLLARPLATDAALRQIRREKTEAVADSAQKAKVGQLADLADAQEYEDLLARERSIISGHTDVVFTGFVTVTAPSPETLDAACAVISRAAGQAACEVRPLYGQQMQAFVAAALPLARTAF
ncbi:MAG: type VII secretion protein EccE [Actinomycetota bacterium]|nr:type VII secretion protein EccE [Actinomycetota bacterium]